MDRFTKSQKALLTAVKEKTCAEVRKLFNEDDLKQDNKWFDYTLLTAALERGTNKSIIHFILDRNCRVNRNDQNNSSHLTPLYYAVKLGDINIVRKLLKKDALVDQTPFDKESPLYLAVREKKCTIVHLLLSARKFVHPNPDDDSDLHYFHVACATSNLKIIEKFVEHGFPVENCYDWDVEEWQGFTPLHFSVENLKLDTFKFLLSQDADLYAKDSAGLTPLHLAFYKQITSSLCKSFIENAFRNRDNKNCINVVDGKGLSIFHIYCTNNIPSIVKIFLRKGADVNSQTRFDSDTYPGYTALHFAILNDCVHVVELLLKYDADVGKIDKEGSTPLHLACQLSREKIVKMLLEHGADATVKDNDGLTPLHSAFYVAEKNDAIIHPLLKHIPMDVNPIDPRGLSHFHIACTRTIPDQVETFLKNGVSPNLCADSDVEKHFERSPLHLAVQFNRITTVRLLLKHGATVNVITEKLKSTPLHLACTFSNTKYYSLIGSPKKVSGKTIDWVSIRKDQIEIIHLLLLYKANINAADSSNKTALFHALDIGEGIILKELSYTRTEIILLLLRLNADVHNYSDKNSSILHEIAADNTFDRVEKVLELLLQKGIDVNVVDKDGATPLHKAVELENLAFAKAVLSNGANVNAKINKYLLTPLHLAVLYPAGINDAVIVLLLNFGCDVNALDAEGKTPLRVAFNTCYDYAVQKLLDHGADINSLDFRSHPTMSAFSDKLKSGRIAAIDPSAKKILCSIEIHLKKLVALGFHVSEKVKECCCGLRSIYKSNYVDFNELDDDMTRCNEELEKMKNIQVDGYSTLYNILFKDENEMVKHLKNGKLMDILLDSNLNADFPLYSYLLALQFKRGTARSKVLKLAKASLQSVTGLSLPDSCSERILRYLTNENIQDLIKTKSLMKNHKRKAVSNVDSGQAAVKQRKSEHN